jgi:hypothetical protein
VVSLTDAKLLALAASWRARAKTFMHEGEESGDVRDVYRLAGMASSLNFAARELCRTADVDPSDGPSVANPEADRACLDGDMQLDRGTKVPTMSASRRKTARAFRQALRAARLARGITHEQLAKTGNFDRTYQSLLERGDEDANILRNTLLGGPILRPFQGRRSATARADCPMSARNA